MSRLLSIVALATALCAPGTASAGNDVSFTCAMGGLLLRVTPAPDGEVAAVLPFNTRVERQADVRPLDTVEGDRTTWVKVHSVLGDGWVSAQYLSEEDHGISAEHSAFERILALHRAVEQKQPIAPLVSPGGVTVSHDSVDRCWGRTTGQVALQKPRMVDEPFVIELTFTGDGWLAEESPSCKPGTRSDTIRLVADYGAVIENAGCSGLEFALGESVTVRYFWASTDLAFDFTLQDGQYRITAIAYGSEDPG